MGNESDNKIKCILDKITLKMKNRQINKEELSKNGECNMASNSCQSW